MGDKIPKFGFKSKKRDNAAGFFGRKLSFISHKLSFISDKLSTINNKLFKKRINYQLSIFGKKLVINYKLLIIVGILVLSGVGGTLALNGFFGGGGDIPEDTMTRGLAGYWSFDEGGGSIARDASGNNNHGTLANGPKWTQGKNGSALQFDGKDDYVNCGNSSSLDITDEITVEAWVKPDMAKNADIVSRYSYSGPTNNGGYILRLWNDGKFYFVTLNDSQGGISANANMKKWNHVVATYDADVGTNNMKLYVNGLLANQTTRANAIKSITQNLKIGAFSYYYDGMVDSVKIYNRALSEAEVRYHYNHGGPVAHWDMDEGSGLTINDKSGNGNDGTISGATWTEGKYGSALSFDGVNDVVNAGNGASLNITKEITVGLWIKRNNLDTVVNRGIIAKDGVGGYVLSLNYGTADHKITYVSPNVGTAKTVSTIDDTEWHYVACTVNESENALKLYIDGKLDASYAKIGTLAANATSLLIGRRSDYFNGLIDDVRIYDYARTEEEIRLDYNAGMATHLGPSGKTCSEDPASCMDYGLVGNWDMDEGTGSVLNDNSGNSNHGTLANGPKWTQGKNGSALQFDGKDDYVNCGSGSSLNDISGVVSIEAWVKNNKSKYNSIVNKRNDNIEGHWDFRYSTSYGLQFVNFDSAGVPKITNSSGVTFDNDWHHLVAVATDSEVKIYMDGKKLATSGALAPIISTNINVKIGGWGLSGNYYLNGKIDEVKIYNRALSEEEVRYHYNHGGPVAHWDMDEGSGSTINDKSGNGNDGTISGAAWTQGKYGSALSFDGADDYVDAGSGGSLDITGSVTVSAWVKTSTTGTYQTIASKASWSLGGNQYLLYVHNGQARFTGTNGSSEFNAVKNGVTANEWHHVAGTYENNTFRVYVDGIPGTSSVLTGTKSTTTQHFSIGASRVSSPIGFFPGIIDDVRVYNYARTEEEIRRDYNAGMAAHLGPSGKTCSEDPASCMDYGLVGNWDMDEGSGSVINDNSGNNNHGTLANGPKWTQGKNGSALDFDGKNDYVAVADSDSLSFGDGSVDGGFTIESWINYDLINSFNIAEKYKEYWLTNSNCLRLYLFDLSSGGVWAKSPVCLVNTYKGEWVHLIVTYDGSGWDGINFYINGKLLSGGSSTGSVAGYVSMENTANPLKIGSTTANGKIDGVKIYNRALSEAEVRYHYNQGGPVAHWDMDEGEGTRAFDSSGNNNHGTISGATWVEGKYGSALSFDGADDYVGCGTSSSLDIANSMTASAWIYPKTLGEGSAGHIVGRGGTAGWCFYVYTSNSLKLLSGAGIQVTSEVNSITLNQWQYVTVVYDKQNVRFFVNGVEKGVTAETDSILNTGSCIIGARTTAGDFDFNGYLDDVRVYNYARTAEEIRLDYQQGVATHLK